MKLPTNRFKLDVFIDNVCGKTRKQNRKGQKYVCKCGNQIHADLNAAINLASEEPIVPKPHIFQ